MEQTQSIIRKVIDPNNRSGIIMNGNLKGRSFEIINGNAIFKGKPIKIDNYDVFYKDVTLNNGNPFEYLQTTRKGTFGKELLPNGMIRNLTLPSNIIITIAPQESVDTSSITNVVNKLYKNTKRKHEDDLAEIFNQVSISSSSKRNRIDHPLSQNYDDNMELIDEEVDSSDESNATGEYPSDEDDEKSEESSSETKERSEEVSEEPEYLAAYSDKDRVSVQYELLTREDKLLKKDIDSIIKALLHKKVLLNNHDYINSQEFVQQVSSIIQKAESYAHKKLKHGDILVIIIAIIRFVNMISKNVMLDVLFGDKGKVGYLLFKGLINLPTVLFSKYFTSEHNYTIPKKIEERVAKAIDIAIRWLEKDLGPFPDTEVNYIRHPKNNKALQKALEPKMYPLKKKEESIESLNNSQSLVDKLVKYGYNKDIVMNAVNDEYERLKNETLRTEEEDFTRDMFVAKTFKNGIYTKKKIEKNINIIENNLHKIKMTFFTSLTVDKTKNSKSLLFDTYINNWHSSMNNYDLIKRRAHEDIKYVTPSLLQTTFSSAIALKSENLETYKAATHSSDIRFIFHACQLYINENYQIFKDFVTNNVSSEKNIQSILKNSLLLWKQEILHFYLNKTINTFVSQFTRTHKRNIVPRVNSYHPRRPMQTRQRATSNIFLPKIKKEHFD